MVTVRGLRDWKCMELVVLFSARSATTSVTTCAIISHKFLSWKLPTQHQNFFPNAVCSTNSSNYASEHWMSPILLSNSCISHLTGTPHTTLRSVPHPLTYLECTWWGPQGWNLPWGLAISVERQYEVSMVKLLHVTVPKEGWGRG